MIDEREFNELKNRLEAIEAKLNFHTHRGTDGSQKINLGDTDLSIQNLTLVGGNPSDEVQSAIKLPLNVVDNISDKKLDTGGLKSGLSELKRGAGFGVGVISKGVQNAEQVNAGIVAGVDSGSVIPPKINQAQLRLIHLSLDTTHHPPYAFLNAQRTPIVLSTGSITNGGNTLTDTKQNFATNELIGLILLLENSSGDILEAYTISSNTATTITINGTWTSATGTYNYYVFCPVFLGSADSPWGRAYFGDRNNDKKAIRLGYGSSDGSQVIWICYGSGSPEGVVAANVGSLYLRTDGGTGTTLYVKESGTGKTGWVAK